MNAEPGHRPMGSTMSGGGPVSRNPIRRCGRQTRIRILPASIVWTWGCVLQCLAAEEPARQESSAAQILYGILPIFVLAVLLWWFLRRSQQSPFMRRSLEHYERSERHMEKMEQIAERIATALETRGGDNVK